MKADEFHEWASSLPGDGNLKALARLSELRNQNNTGLSGELYQEMMRQNRDQVKREFEELKEVDFSKGSVELIPADQIVNPNATFTIEDDKHCGCPCSNCSGCLGAG